MFVTGIILVAIAAAILLGLVAVWLFRQRKQSRDLRQRFGPEYDRSVSQFGSRKRAESELRARERRVEGLNIVPLTPSEAARFAQAWEGVQGRFVDNPKSAVGEADKLVRELMLERGYPMGDFDRRAADISVDHPKVVDNYRAAHAIVVRDEHGEAETEDLRQAVVHYRALFDELLEVGHVRAA